MKRAINFSPAPRSSEIIMAAGASHEASRYINNYSQTVLVADKKAFGLWEKQIKKLLPDGCQIILIEGSDEQKNLRVHEKILSTLVRTGCDRQSLIISFGGGVISDLAGFAASTYMRGLDWIAIPTTLAAQSDAAIGGKTGVNISNYKNMVGSFWPPRAVLIDPAFLKTLDRRELTSGFGEIIKMGFIYDKNILKLLDKIDPRRVLGPKLDEASMLSAVGKIDIVNKDFYEKNERKLLNFGHTIGHAVEAMFLDSTDPLLHGEAVGIGMVAEAKLAELEGVCEKGISGAIIATLNRFGLPAQIAGAKADEIIKKIALDKKNTARKILWTLPTGIGQGKYNHEAETKNIQKAVEFIGE